MHIDERCSGTCYCSHGLHRDWHHRVLSVLASASRALCGQAQAEACGPVHPHTADGDEGGATNLICCFSINSTVGLFVRCYGLLEVCVREELARPSAVQVHDTEEFHYCVSTDLGADDTSGSVVLGVWSQLFESSLVHQPRHCDTMLFILFRNHCSIHTEKI